MRAGDVLEVGDVRLELVRPRVPCAVMNGIRPGLEKELRGRGGWCARVRSGGSIAVGDDVGRDHVDHPDCIAEYLKAIAEWEASPPKRGRQDGWTFPERLAHLCAWDERGIERIEALAAGAPEEHFTDGQIDAFNAAARDRILGASPKPNLWVLWDLTTTKLIDTATAHPKQAEYWLQALAAHYREHS